ncbi:MAG: DUF3489 domain-containing protein [Burkholderiaceae bacterium]|nr:DUF3489 domain-containing protein [Burkholderiaceae bacterium]
MNTKAARKTAQPARKAAAPAKAAPSAKTPKRAVRASKTKPIPVVATPAGSKQSQLLVLLHSPTGATIKQMTDLTGWQAHTVRGAISGVLRKRLGLNVMCTPDPSGGARIYRIASA